MGFLPVKAKVGGKSEHGLKLMSDMTDIGSKKINSPHAKKMGKLGHMYKNPGGKHDGSNSHVKSGGRKRT